MPVSKAHEKSVQLETQLQDVGLVSGQAVTYLGQLTVQIDLTETQVGELILQSRAEGLDVCAGFL
ncbi:MAG TPA: hypothetical protein EYQ25_10030 [Planctomycetes bacterium]|nr:hypothetical protein [Planctomycetota bacterium]HIL38421.1 hypothetical protein [Planctomycetota bacterium]